MKLYYTVSSGSEQVQTKTSLSLGGYKSSSPLVNSQIGNLFSDITAVTINNFNQNQYIGLVLKNETGIAVTGVSMWFEYPDQCFSIYRVAAIDMITDSSGDKIMEHISNISSKPLNAEFYEAADGDHPVDLGDLAIDEQIGIWIERELLPEVITAQQSDVYAPDPDPAHLSRFVEVVLPKLDEINIGISWS